ncbi:MAG: ABC transporter ATP-binding protein [Chloroflexota bacterium]|nr:ABC transporter ATP-binding protein [Chloroflexota bacterium]
MTTSLLQGFASADALQSQELASELSSDPKTSMLECQDVSKSFGDVVALSNFSLKLGQGQILALLGPSGCGKTTALRLISGFANPDDGSITIAARPVYDQETYVPPEKRSVGMVFQEGALFPHLTVEQNIAFGLSRDDQRSDRVAEVVKMTGLEGLTQRMPYELSGGQQQRVALARALAPRPELLLLDEPFSNLDPALREQVRRDVMNILRSNRITAIFVTHDQEEAMYVGDSIAVMNGGRIEQQGTPEEIFHHPSTRFVAEFIGMVDFVTGRWEDGVIKTPIGTTEWENDALADGALEVMIRPDCLECIPSEKGNGAILEREFRGASYLYMIALDGSGTVRCLLPHIDEHEVGSRVTVRVRSGHSLRPFLNGVAVGV